MESLSSDVTQLPSKGRLVFLTEENPFSSDHPDLPKTRNRHLIQALLATGQKVEVLYVRPSQGKQSLTHDGLQLTAISTRNTPLWKLVLDLVKSGRKARGAFSFTTDTHVIQALEKSAKDGANLLWLSRLRMAGYIRVAQKMGYRVILDEIQVESREYFFHAIARLKTWPAALRAPVLAYLEQRFCSAAHAVIASSKLDACRLQKLDPKLPLHVVPNGVSSSEWACPILPSEGTTLVFRGDLDDEHTHDSLNWFFRAIYPRLKAALRERMPKILLLHSGDSQLPVRWTEYTEVEIRALGSASEMCSGMIYFNPVRTGKECQVRLMEAMAAGRPVVSTSRAIEGLVLAPTYDLLIADRADSFASAILKLHSNPKLRDSIGAHASETIRKNYDLLSCCKPILEQVLNSVLASTRGQKSKAR